MVANPVSKPRTKLQDTSKEETKAYGTSLPALFIASTTLLLVLYKWPWKWLVSGTPILTFCILLGSAKGYRVLAFVPLWSLIITVNFVYSIAATSWLLYWFFAAACYPAIFLTCIFQFNIAANFMRKNLRRILHQLQFVNDKVAFFDIPALEIDTDVDGLMVVRGITFSLSTLSFVVHGIEVGIKLAEDIELAIQTEKVTVHLFRKIEVEDCFANLKGGAFEMTFGDMETRSHDEEGDALMVANTPLLQMAAQKGDTSRPPVVKMKSQMTDGKDMKDSSAKKGYQSITQISLDDDETAKEVYKNTITWIESTNFIRTSRERVHKRAREAEAQEKSIDNSKDKNKSDETAVFDYNNTNDLRAAICSSLHDKPTIPHPPRRSIKVTTLQNLSSPAVRRFMHRLPMLLRLLLNPISYFHPVSITSITVAGSGKWITHMLKQAIFQSYGEDNSEIARLEERVSAWLSDANFALSLADITGLAQVPFLSAFDITAFLSFGDVMAYRTLPREVNLKQVVRLGGLDATFTIPSFLLPHHEHLLPPVPAPSDKEKAALQTLTADGKPHTVQKEREMAQLEKDEANVKISVHARLPACLDQELLNFIAALVKATKIVEMEKAPGDMVDDVKTVRDFTHNLSEGFKSSMKRAAVDGIVSDRLIAKMVGKITKKLETAQGDVGYSGDIPVPLGPRRLKEGDPEANKLLA